MAERLKISPLWAQTRQGSTCSKANAILFMLGYRYWWYSLCVTIIHCSHYFIYEVKIVLTITVQQYFVNLTAICTSWRTNGLYFVTRTWLLWFSMCECESCLESTVLQLKLKALILDIIHNISVVKQLNQEGVSSLDAWAWKKQLRFYMGPDKCCHIHMVDAQFSYTYEYQVCWHVDTS